MSIRTEQLFSDALARPEQERAAFLDGACHGDASLRARILALIAAHEGPESLLASASARTRADMGGAAPEKPGEHIARYKLLQKIGEGGCGVVWMAEQEEPVRRRVALKVIKLGMDTKAVVARFEAERQALAMMDHPCIAKVHDAGATDTGRPYFVMELVRGIPITKYCDENHLTAAARLELFIKVCQAVQHAHQKGIIHRDLKPSNILVTVNDGAPTPKVIDFGIAKATQGKLTDATVFTAFEQFIGTPVYMSPEQAEMSSLDIDTRSDIYSLGVLLYELLTGRPPFDPKTFAQAGVDQIRQLIREVEPPRPSARLSTLDENERTTIAQLRGTAAANLSLILRGDLDWIVMRCIEKDRTRRYDTANGLAMDIQRYLRNEPVVARPPSTAYLLQKLIRRHRLLFTAGAMITLALVAGFGVSVWSLLKEKVAREQARSAEHAERAMRQRAQLAEAVGADARTRSEDVLGFMLTDLSKELKLFGLSRVLTQAAERAVTYYEGLSPALRNADTAVGYGRALAISASVLDDQGDPHAAQPRFAKALEVLSPLAAGPNPAARLAYAEALVNFAWFNFNRLDYVTQLENARAAEATLAPLLPDPVFAGAAHQALTLALRQQATAIQFSAARVSEGLVVYERAIAVADAADQMSPRPKYPGLASALIAGLFSEALFEAGAYTRAQDMGRRSYETLQRIITSDPNLWTPRVWAGFARHYDSRVSYDDWDEHAGRNAGREAAESVHNAILRDPNALLERAIWAFMGSGTFVFCYANGDWAEAEEVLRQLNERYASTGTNRKLQFNHGALLAHGAATFAATGRNAEADEWLAAARAKIQASVVSLPAGSPERLFGEAALENNLRNVGLQRLEFAAVRANATATLTVLAQLPRRLAVNSKDDGGDPRASAHFHSGQAAFFSGDFAAAADAFAAAAEALNEWWAERLVVPGSRKSRQDRADTAELELYRIHAMARAGRRDEAQSALAPLVREVLTLSGYRPDLFITQRLVARMFWIRAEIETDLPRTERRTLLEQARQIYRAADREKRLNRIHREVILPEIEKSLAAIAGRETQ